MGAIPKWFVFTMFFGLLPFLLTVFLGYAQNPGADLFQPSPELLFFTLTACASALGELFDREDVVRHEKRLDVLTGLLIVGAVGGAVLYGSYVGDLVEVPVTGEGVVVRLR